MTQPTTTPSAAAPPTAARPRPDRHSVVLETLGQQIVAGDPAPGGVLRLDEVEARFGVSRGVVREVVRVLESIGLVRSRRRVGVTVQPSDQWNPYAPPVIRWRLAGPHRIKLLLSLSELRAAVEPAAGRLAALRATPEQCGILTSSVIGMTVAARSQDLETYLDHDVRFHRTLLAASGNPMFDGLAAVVAEVLNGRTHHHLMPTNPEPAAIMLHGAVASAVASGEQDEAEQSLRAIVAESAEALSGLAAASQD